MAPRTSVSWRRHKSFKWSPMEQHGNTWRASVTRFPFILNLFILFIFALLPGEEMTERNVAAWLEQSVRNCFGNTDHTEMDKEIKGIMTSTWVILTGAVKTFTAFSRNFYCYVKGQLFAFSACEWISIKSNQTSACIWKDHEAIIKMKTAVEKQIKAPHWWQTSSRNWLY